MRIVTFYLTVICAIQILLCMYVCEEWNMYDSVSRNLFQGIMYACYVLSVYYKALQLASLNDSTNHSPTSYGSCFLSLITAS